MITLQVRSRDTDFTPYDHVFETTEKFYDILPYLLPKLEGQWKLLLIEPKLEDLRALLDTQLVPSYLSLAIVVDSKQLEQLYMERPQLAKEVKSNWDVYMDLLKTFPVQMEDKAMREIYYRVGPTEKALRAALEELKDYSNITVKVVDKHFVRVNRVYASQVMRLFLLGKYKQAWKLLGILERELGSKVAFYAMRKSIRNIFAAKRDYLRNVETRERIVTQADSYTIVFMYMLFEEAHGPEQLYLILDKFERRQLSC